MCFNLYFTNTDYPITPLSSREQFHGNVGSGVTYGGQQSSPLGNGAQGHKVKWYRFGFGFETEVNKHSILLAWHKYNNLVDLDWTLCNVKASVCTSLKWRTL